MAASMEGEGVDINLTPLLDLVLQLIMFFMITVNFVASEQFAANVDLPVAQMAVPLKGKAKYRIFVNLDAEGNKVGALENVPLHTPERFKAFLINVREDFDRIARRAGDSEWTPVVVIRADRNCRYGDIWHVVDTCQKAGFLQWQLRVMTGA